jgi:hypothetical protein
VDKAKWKNILEERLQWAFDHEDCDITWRETELQIIPVILALVEAIRTEERRNCGMLIFGDGNYFGTMDKRTHGVDPAAPETKEPLKDDDKSCANCKHLGSNVINGPCAYCRLPVNWELKEGTDDE